MKDIQLTLYDIFGYLFPGCIGFIAIFLIAWRLVLPTTIDINSISTTGLIVVLGISYTVGHFMQAISNIIWKDPKKKILTNTTIISTETINIVKNSVRKIIGLPQNDNIDEKTAFDIVDHYLQQHGKTENRDIYIYREGFYRGLSISFCLLAVSLFFHFFGKPVFMAIFGLSITVTHKSAIFFCILSIIMALLSVGRYKRFVEYRIKNSLYSFLAINSMTGRGDAK